MEITEYDLDAILSEALSFLIEKLNLSGSVGFLTLRHLRWQIVRLLSTDMHPVEVIVQVLVVVTGSRTIIERTSPYGRNLLLVYLKAELFQESSRGVPPGHTTTTEPTQPVARFTGLPVQS